MSEEPVKAHDLLSKYGPQLSQQILTDMLKEITNSDERQEIEEAVEELAILIQTDEKGLFLASPKTVTPSMGSLPPAYVKNSIQIWLFDDAVISYNSIAKFYHGYRKQNGKTSRLGKDEINFYRDLIDNPQKILNL